MKKNLKEHHEESFGKDESYETFVNEIKSMAEGIMQLSLQAVQDGATRPVYYESRVIKLKLDDKVLAG